MSRLYTKITENLSLIKNWVFPKKCLICSCTVDENSIFCKECFKNITLIDYPFCKCCGRLLNSSFNEDMICENCSNYPDNFFDIGRSLFVYDNFSKKAIMKLKKQADEYVAKTCAKMIYKKYSDIFSKIDVIVPVPSHFTRILKRGFNPPDLIAKYLSLISGIKLDKNIIKRKRKTPTQANKTLLERKQNVSDAFSCKKNLDGLSILLVDDVFTTGATINECSKLLKSSKAVFVGFITIASVSNSCTKKSLTY